MPNDEEQRTTPIDTVIPIISLKSISKNFPGVKALSNFSFDVRQGELHAICGENGAGKSTLMKILSGVITDYDGTLEVDGTAVQFQGTRDAERNGVSIIHQELNLVEQLSVADNVFLGRELRTRLGLCNNAAMTQATRTLLRELECDIDPRVPAGSLRVGDQQLVEIAKAVSLQSRILIMDEPTSALTESEVARLYRVIARLRSKGTTILYISHKMEEVFRLSDRITILRDGNFVSTLNTPQTDAAEVTRLMVGRELLAMDLPVGNASHEILLKVNNLSLPWKGHARGYRLKDISFELRPGEILGIAGLMGAGRTELLECLFGASQESPTGAIELSGKPFRPDHPADACRAGVALVTEDRKRLGIFSAMNVGQNTSISALSQATTTGIVSHSKERSMVDRMIDQLKIKTAGQQVAITGLSGGNQQKCIVGRWLLRNPRVLLLDDPTRGVDVGAKAELYRLIRSLCNSGLGVILTSSELPELLTLSDRIMVLSEGRMTALFSRDEATQAKIMEAATVGWQSHATSQ